MFGFVMRPSGAHTSAGESTGIRSHDLKDAAFFEKFPGQPQRSEGVGHVFQQVAHYDCPETGLGEGRGFQCADMDPAGPEFCRRKLSRILR